MLNYSLEQLQQVICSKEKLMRFREFQNAFCQTDDILIAGYENDGVDHDETIRKVPQTYRKEAIR